MSAVNQPADRARCLAEGWADYRRRQWAAGLTSIGCIPLAMLIGLGIETLKRSDRLVALFVLPLAILTFGAWSRFVLFRCPNCGRHFHITESWRLTSGRKCPHCGLARYQAD
jgi:DNA-directed RNA polymerase subunit RPC12/RpoP